MKLEASKITIITPCFNGEKYIQQYFDCVKSFTYHNIQLIFVDDGSTDKTSILFKECIVDLQESKYEILYLYQENAGAAAAVKYGMKYVTGKYLILLDIDDVSKPQLLYKLALFLDEYTDYGMVRCNGYYVKSNRLNEKSYVFTSKKKEKRNTHIFEYLLLGKTYNWPGTYMIRMEYLLKCYDINKFHVSQFGQNLQLMLPISYHYKTGFIDEYLHCYVNNANSHSNNKSTSEYIHLLNGYEENRISIVQSMDLNLKYESEILEKVRLFYNHQRLILASKSNDKEIADKMKKKLKSKNDYTLKDEVLYILTINQHIKYTYDKLSLPLNIFRVCLKKTRGLLR